MIANMGGFYQELNLLEYIFEFSISIHMTSFVFMQNTKIHINSCVNDIVT